MTRLRELFNDKFTRASALVFALTVITVVFNTFFHVEVNHPLIGVFAFAMVPLLVVIGGIVFIIAIWRLKE
ncbi:MAG: hypothetical protein PHE50_09450 [Dehalococcoidales bacterium]|nr:hypothetical protein [Dehalococcoidales bacterium]